MTGCEFTLRQLLDRIPQLCHYSLTTPSKLTNRIQQLTDIRRKLIIILPVTTESETLVGL